MCCKTQLRRTFAIKLKTCCIHRRLSRPPLLRSASASPSEFSYWYQGVSGYFKNVCFVTATR